MQVTVQREEGVRVSMRPTLEAVVLARIGVDVTSRQMLKKKMEASRRGEQDGEISGHLLIVHAHHQKPS